MEDATTGGEHPCTRCQWMPMVQEYHPCAERSTHWEDAGFLALAADMIRPCLTAITMKPSALTSTDPASKDLTLANSLDKHFEHTPVYSIQADAQDQ